MKVKRYVAETAQEALQKVRSDLGRDAIILNTRKIRRKGIAGIFSKPLIEVVATIDSDLNNQPIPKQSPIRPAASQPAAQPINQTAYKPAEPPVQNEAMNFMNELNATIENNKKAEYATQKESAEGKVEISEIRSMINKVYDAVKPDYENGKLSDLAKSYLKILEDNEIDKTIISDIKEDIIDLLDSESQRNEAILQGTIYSLLSNYMKDPEPFNFEKDKKVVIFIGPTGVGKTTTLAKLAANMVLSERKKVGLITSDTYRIAAVEQLKTYSEIIGVPLSIIYSPSEIQNAIKNYKDYDLILVDTAGRSHKDKYQLMELKSLINSSIDYEVYLVMSATTKFTDCIEIIKSYSFLDDYKLIFTKLDETSSLGVILNVAYITKKPLSYITTGQSVPDDIEVADKDRIVNCLLGDNLYERSS